MGGHPKGLLTVPNSDETLLSRTVRIAAESAPGAEVVLVGENRAYAHLHLPTLADDPPGIGPVGGLRALLKYSARHGRPAIALACDMPFLSTRVIQRLIAWPSHASVVCPKRHDRWEPFCARYSPEPCLVALEPLLDSVNLGQRGIGFQQFLNTVPTERLPLNADEEHSLFDWDTPSDRNAQPCHPSDRIKAGK